MCTTEAELSKYQDSLLAAASWISEADYVVIVAGAGMSIGCGLNYSSREDFKKQYPAMLQYGLHTGYECMGLGQRVAPEIAWGFLSQHIWNMRYRDKPHQGYVDLFNIVGKKDYFIHCSNVDGLFERAGFDVKANLHATRRFQEPAGSCCLQCMKPCSREVYPSLPIIEKIIPTIDKATQRIPSAMVPKCPKCSGPMMANVRGGDWFIHDPYLAQNRAFVDFVSKTQSDSKKLVVLEIGAGFNTPSVTRWPAESIARWHKNGSMVRINFDHSELPFDLVRAVGIPSDGRPALALLRKYCYSTSATTAEQKTGAGTEGDAKSADAAKQKEAATAAAQREIEKRELIRKRMQEAAESEGSEVVEMWQQVKERFGHFDWQKFMASLARNSEEGEGEGDGDE